ncbi:Chromo domain/ SNF2 Atpase/Helicase domain containing protein [Cryptosporidium hominis]|uniref:Chromo domain/ SNF2 Atpase/Helicase domain containing protein n=1 Tax=Cryptosporidium hominis TaxID=237895 RepID=A0ABX5BFZ9_CRYHO|nr:chromodomain-helicase-DNA-binding protein, CHD-1-related [Cryptosporidium hominis TU502]PPS97237.1 Chromo domain/ SNF2 Atpase/Helicase domain containing protein [Cryptosporidium hominis]|eukprot:PPS97237.1 Chromo domain/ SNF2 Atpase/Helicase domain containing protein [Cryptosporidium hominis]
MDLDVEFSDSSTEGEFDTLGKCISTEDISPEIISRNQNQAQTSSCSRSGRVRKMRYSNFSNIDNESELSDESLSEFGQTSKMQKTRERSNRNKGGKSRSQSQKSEDLDYVNEEDLYDGDDEEFMSEDLNNNVDAKRTTDSDDGDEDFYEEPTQKKRGRKPSKTKVSQTSGVKRTVRSSRKAVNYLSFDDSVSSDSLSQDSDEVEVDAEVETEAGMSVSAQQNVRTIDRVISSRQNPEDPNITEYKIKWMGYSHLHNTWESAESLINEGVSGLRRLENFQKKMAEMLQRRKFMTEDEIEQEDITFEIQRQLDFDALIPERIVDVYRENDNSGVDQNSAEDRTQLYYFVKWLSCPYDQCTWESYETLEEHKFLSFIDSFYAQMELVSKFDKNCDYEMRSLALTSFEPYLSTPFYMGIKVKDMLNQSKDLEKMEIDDPISSNIQEMKIEYHSNNENEHGNSITEDVKMEIKDSQKLGKIKEEVENIEESNDEPFQPRTLRDYQIYGLNWMISRFKKNVNILLADEMGLGKTVQTISVVGHCLYMEKIVAPFLVVVPQSTSDNWLREFKKWLPDANVVLYHGNAYARELIRSYELSKIEMKDEVDENGNYNENLESKDEVHNYNQKGMQSCARAGTGGNGFFRRCRSRSSKQTRKRYRFDIVITTPSILNSQVDCDFLRQIDWYMMIVDEAHQLKNRDSKRFKELHEFGTMYRLLLSGTPLHNNLEELWSLLHFLNPLRFQNYQEFRLRYPDIENPNVIGPDKQRQLEDLQSELQEYVLRRVKKDVEKSLPNKVERILRVELSPQQTDMYKSILTRNYDELSKTTGGTKTSLQNICMELKKVCNHPFLIHRPELDPSQGITIASIQHQLVYGCGKLCLLDKLLSRLREKGSRVLIFSQMVRMLNIISEFLVLRGFRHQRLDGTMGKELRKKAMDHFNSPNSDDFCFLLSTKAGGLGINLTTADTVIIYDSDWNPQNDLQAEARAHRIGQKKQVQIYRLVTKDSIEENILERAKTKMVLDTLVVQGLNNISTSSSQTQASSSAAASVLAMASQALYPNGKKPGSGGASFSRDELAKILKFGAQKLWSKGTNNVPAQSQSGSDSSCGQCADGQCGETCMHRAVNVDGTQGVENKLKEDESSADLFEDDKRFASQIDLDQVLADAEEHVHDTQGLADGLLRSFANIADFRYEAPPLIIDSNTGALVPLNEKKKEDNEVDFDSKEFWEKTIPEEERLKLIEKNQQNTIITGPRKSAMRDGSLKYRDDGYTYVGGDNSGSEDGRTGRIGDQGLEADENFGTKGKKQSKKKTKEKSVKKSSGSGSSGKSRASSSSGGSKKMEVGLSEQIEDVEMNLGSQKDLDKTPESLGELVPNREEYPLPEHSLQSREDFEALMLEITSFPHKYNQDDELFPSEINIIYRDISNGVKCVKNGKRARRDSRVLHPKRRFKLFRSILKFGDPYRRLDDIIIDSRLKGKVEKGTILNESQIIVALCYEKAQKELSSENVVATSKEEGEIKDEDDVQNNKSNNEATSILEGQSTTDSTIMGGGVPLEVGSMEDFAEENDIENNNQVSKTALKKNLLLIGSHRANALELVERIKMLSSLDKLMRECNPGVEKPWKLPTGPLARPDRESVKRDEDNENEDDVDDEDEDLDDEEEKEKSFELSNENNLEEKKIEPTNTENENENEKQSSPNGNEFDGNYLKFELPPVLVKSLRTPSWGIPWTLQTDIDILKGIYIYGFSNWTMMSMDENLSLSCIKRIKFDKLKQRTLRVMKHLHSVMVIGKTARKKRKFIPSSDQEYNDFNKNENSSSKRGKKVAKKCEDQNKDGTDLSGHLVNDNSNGDNNKGSTKSSKPLVVGGKKGLPEFVLECSNMDEKELRRQARTCFNNSNVKPQLLEIKKLFHPSNNMTDSDVVASLKVLLPVVGDEINEILKLATNEISRNKVHNCLWSYVAKCTVFQPHDIEKIYLSWKGINPPETNTETVTEVNPDPVIEPEPEPKPENEPKLEPEPKPGNEPGSESKSEPEPSCSAPY